MTFGLVLPAGYWLAEPHSKAGQGESLLPSTAQTQPAARLLTVSTRELSAAGPEFLTQSYTGIVAARRSSRLASKDVARVESVVVELGDAVDVGQLLIQLDAQQLKATRQVAAANLRAAQAKLDELSRGPRTQDIEQADAQVDELRANLELSRANFARVSELRKSSAVSKQEFDESRFALEAMEARLNSAEQNLERLQEGSRVETIAAQAAVVSAMEAELKRIDADIQDRSIRAPFSGSIQARLIDEGSVVSPGQALLEIIEDAPYELRVGVPPEVAQRITDNEFHLSYAGQPLAGSLTRVAPSINERTRTREIVLALNESSSHLVRIGGSVTVTVQMPVESEGFWVPSTCLTAGPRGLWAVYVIDDVVNRGKGDGPVRVERRQVELLRAQGAWSEIRGPLAPSDRLVIEGVHRATPGQLVRTKAVPTHDTQRPW